MTKEQGWLPLPLHTLVRFQTWTIIQTSKMTKDTHITRSKVKTAAISSPTASKSNKECITETINNKSSQNRFHIVNYSSITWQEGSSKTTLISAVALISPHNNHTAGQVQQTTNIKSITSMAACNECQRNKPQSLLKKWQTFSKNSWMRTQDWEMK